MSLIKSEFIDSIERIDEMANALYEIRHRLVQEFEEILEDGLGKVDSKSCKTKISKPLVERMYGALR
jgi:hypothetical protein